jgi:hypothetical protein
MTSADYGFLLEVFKGHFGEYVTLLNQPQRRKAAPAVTGTAQGNEATR